MWHTHVAKSGPGGIVNAVREDPRRKGLLFAGTKQTVYVSFDDGDHWQSLRLNLAPSSVRDLVIKDNDLVVATHGRGFWILDDVTPLRQIDQKVAAAETFLFKPQTTYRVRWNMKTFQSLDFLRGQSPAASLIGVGGISEAVGNNPFPMRKSRQNQFIQVFPPGGKH